MERFGEIESLGDSYQLFTSEDVMKLACLSLVLTNFLVCLLVLDPHNSVMLYNAYIKSYF